MPLSGIFRFSQRVFETAGAQRPGSCVVTARKPALALHYRNIPHEGIVYGPDKAVNKPL